MQVINNVCIWFLLEIKSFHVCLVLYTCMPQFLFATFATKSISIVRFTKFVASIFRDFFKSTGQNVTKHTSLEFFFNLASVDAVLSKTIHY